ncbi:MAG: hypothetical protein HYX63_05875 [Gammaproteobacteria bacterium]|nr:hypothetical protein [Gammaproteobacteria bacterium]
MATSDQRIKANGSAIATVFNPAQETRGRFVLDNDGIIAGCDAGCEQLFAAPERELVGWHISKLRT